MRKKCLFIHNIPDKLQQMPTGDECVDVIVLSN